MSLHSLELSEICEMVTGFPLEKVVVFDTETTGVNTSTDEVLSIAACDGYGNKLISTKVRPVRHSGWPDAQRVNGISPQMVRNAPTIGELRPRLRRILLGDVLLVGYNTQFDIHMLWSNGVLDGFPKDYFDVMRQYAAVRGTGRKTYGGYRYSKLAVCAGHYGYTFRAHDSMEDALATLWCFRALICDEKWLHATMDGKAKQMRAIVASQTKATTATVKDLVAAGMGSDSAAELRVGEITRGKSKGEKRYELYSNGSLVGTLTPKATERARSYLMVADGEELPSPVKCSAMLTMNGGTAHATVDISDRRNVIRAMYDGARLSRENGGCQWRNAQTKKREPESSTVFHDTPEEARDGKIEQRRSISTQVETEEVERSQRHGAVAAWIIIALIIFAIIGLPLIFLASCVSNFS
ncbi:MAG: 3'-5' exonuclease [Coriobacteriaceae bacterium]|nr:3'-5' exonuclease [Coriobacteriaceae bacterium]